MLWIRIQIESVFSNFVEIRIHAIKSKWQQTKIHHLNSALSLCATICVLFSCLYIFEKNVFQMKKFIFPKLILEQWEGNWILLATRSFDFSDPDSNWGKIRIWIWTTRLLSTHCTVQFGLWLIYSMFSNVRTFNWDFVKIIFTFFICFA